MDKLGSLFANSTLADHEQKELLALLANLSKDELDELSGFLSLRPEWAGVLYRNYKKKRAAAVILIGEAADRFDLALKKEGVENI